MKTEDDNAVILCVDDESVVLNSLRSLFTEKLKLIRHIEIAQSAEEALEVVKELEEDGLDLQVVLVDYIMPCVKGDEFLVKLHAIRPQTKKIMLTGQSDLSGIKRAINAAGLYRFMDKPWNNEDMLLTVEAAITSYRQTMEIQQHNRQLQALNQELEQKVIARTQELEQKVIARTQKLQIQNNQLIQLNREKNEFLSIAAHDLKNPLQAVQGFAALIADTMTDEEYDVEQIIEFANMIDISADRMFGLITNLLDVNAIESGKIKVNLQHVDILPILQKVVDEYTKKAATKNITVHFTPEQDSYFAHVDLNTVHQILDNLVSNAVKYSPLGKRIFIRITQREQQINVEIQDEGQGISQNDQVKLFGKFTRLTAKPTGGEHSTGLGLFIVKKLISILNGHISCESSLGQGATFTVTFPKQIEVKS